MDEGTLAFGGAARRYEVDGQWLRVRRIRPGWPDDGLLLGAYPAAAAAFVELSDHHVSAVFHGAGPVPLEVAADEREWIALAVARRLSCSVRSGTRPMPRVPSEVTLLDALPADPTDAPTGPIELDAGPRRSRLVRDEFEPREAKAEDQREVPSAFAPAAEESWEQQEPTSLFSGPDGGGTTEATAPEPGVFGALIAESVVIGAAEVGTSAAERVRRAARAQWVERLARWAEDLPNAPVDPTDPERP